MYYPVGVALHSLPPAASVALGLLLVVLLLLSGCLALSMRRLRLQEKELATMKKMLHERNTALDEAKQNVQNLKRLLSKESPPMLQVTHELRAPVASIYHTLDVLLQGYTGGAPPEQVEMLCLARDRAGAMLALVNDFLHLGALRRAEIDKRVVPVQLVDVLWRVVPEMRIKATLRGVDLQLDIPDSLPPIGATEEHIAQLLSNLIDNAIKYTDPGGRVVVTLREDGGYLVGSVADTGIGIPPEDMSRIFDEFYRAENAKKVEPYGTGLGLPIVKRVVELYSGHLYVESELDKGSKFTFIFPKVEKAGVTGTSMSNVHPGQ